MNPFELTPERNAEWFFNWAQLRPQAYERFSQDPYTRTRVILMNGTEFENVWFSHQFSRHTLDNDLRRQLALIRRSEQQQQKLLSYLKPADETVLEHTLGYEQLAVDLTAELAQRVSDPSVRKALDFALLEDFDHLYRYSDLMVLQNAGDPERIIDRYTEIMPGRPAIAHHRHPYDSIRFAMTNHDTPLINLLATNIITAAEQQTMNFYMNTAATYPTEPGRKLYQEIGMVEEQHVSQYGSLLNPRYTWLENLLIHQYVECWLYWSCFTTETSAVIKPVWEKLFQQELLHLHTAESLLRKYENKTWQQLFPDAEFPEPLSLHSNIPYVREVLGETVQLTAQRERYVDVSDLPARNTFYEYQNAVNTNLNDVTSHTVIEQLIARDGEDYRFETAPNPIPELRDRTKDNVQVGRVGEQVLITM